MGLLRKVPRRSGSAAGKEAGRSDAEIAELRSAVNSRPWFHIIDLGDGILTPGVDRSREKLDYLAFPDSFAGKSVLDIGAYDGFFSFEAERRGAELVVACDDYCWSFPEGTMADGRGFDIAHAALGSGVRKLRLPVEEISPATAGTFDYVLFLGVLYHAPDPLGYLRHVYSVCRETAIIETHVDAMDQDRPMMVFYPKDTLAGDSSNYWGPNEQCVLAMLEEVGFSRAEVVGASGNRMTFHAHR